jgi:hypothetical protein
MSVGLGLGDFCGVIAVCRESGGESVVADADGERYTPSVVSIGEGGVVVSLRTCKVFPPSPSLALLLACDWFCSALPWLIRTPPWELL